jgi:hypothetical protein
MSFITSGAPFTNTSIVGLASFLTITLILLRADTNSNVWIIPNSTGGVLLVAVVSYIMIIIKIL